MSSASASWKDKISSPLEAGASLAPGHQLPAHLIPALEYASKKLAKKDLSVTLLVIRKEYQIPPRSPSPAEHHRHQSLPFSPSAVLNPPPSAPPYVTTTTYPSNATSASGKHAFATATFDTIKHFVRSSNLSAPASVDGRERKTRSQPPQPFHVAGQIHNRSWSAATVLTPPLGPAPGWDSSSPSEARTPSATYSSTSSNGSGDAKQKATRWLGGSPAGGPGSSGSNSNMPMMMMMSPAPAPGSMTPGSSYSATSTLTANMATRSARTPVSAMSEATLTVPSPTRRFAIKLLYSAPMSSKDERTLLAVIEKTQRKFKIEPHWLPAPISPFSLGLSPDLVQRSLRQNEALFTSPYYTLQASAASDPSDSRNSLRLLSLDHLYDLRCTLVRYTRTRAGPHLEDAVDELRRLILSRGRRRLLKSVLLASYHNADFNGVHGDRPDSLGPGNALSHLGLISEAALNDLSRMYALAYGQEGIVNDVSAAVPNWPLPNGCGEVDAAVGEMMMTATMSTADMPTMARSGSIAWGRPALGSVARAREALARRRLERQLETEQEELMQRERRYEQENSEQEQLQLQQQQQQQQQYSHTPKSSYSSTMTAGTTATMASIATAATSVSSGSSPPRLSISNSPRFSCSSTTWLFSDLTEKAQIHTLASVTEPAEEAEEQQREEVQEQGEEVLSTPVARTLEAHESPPADAWYRDLRLVASNDYATKAARSPSSPTPWMRSGGRTLSPARSVETLLAGGDVPGSGALDLVLSTVGSGGSGGGQGRPQGAARHTVRATTTTFTTTMSTKAAQERALGPAPAFEIPLLTPRVPEDDMDERVSIRTDTTSQVIESFPSPPSRSRLLKAKASSLSTSSASSSRKDMISGGGGAAAEAAAAFKTAANLGANQDGARLGSASGVGGKSLALKLQTSFDGGDEDEDSQEPGSCTCCDDECEDPCARHDAPRNSALFRPRLRSAVARSVVFVDASDRDSGLLDLAEPQQAQELVATPLVPSPSHHHHPHHHHHHHHHHALAVGETEYSCGEDEVEPEEGDGDRDNDDIATLVSASDYDREHIDTQSDIYSLDYDDDDFDFGTDIDNPSSLDGVSPASVRRTWASARGRQSARWSGQQQQQQQQQQQRQRLVSGQSGGLGLGPGLGLGIWTGVSSPQDDTPPPNMAGFAAGSAAPRHGGAAPVSRCVSASSIAEMMAQLRAAARVGEFARDTPSAYSPADGGFSDALLEKAIAAFGPEPEPATARGGSGGGMGVGLGIEDVCNDVGLTPVATSFTGPFSAGCSSGGGGLVGAAARVGPATPNAPAEVSPATRNEWGFLMMGKPGGPRGKTAHVEKGEGGSDQVR